MLLTHRAADFASGDARSQLRPGQFEIGSGEARNHPRGGEADIGAIVIVADALPQLCHLTLRQTGISARVACFGTGITSRDALDDNGVVR